MDIEDILLCTPYEKRRGRDLGAENDTQMKSAFEKLFNESFYCELIWDKKIEALEIKMNQTEDYETQMEILDEINECKKCKKEKTEFEDALTSNVLQNNLFYICGYSGSGKTTYLNNLLYRLPKSKNFVVKLDFYDSVQDVLFLQRIWHNYSFEHTMAKFDSLLIACLNGLLEKPITKDIKFHKALIKRYCLVYDKYYTQSGIQEHDELFKILKKYCQNEDMAYCSDKLCYETFCTSVREYFINYLKGKQVVKKQNERRGVLLRIITFFIISQAMTKDLVLRKNVIIAFDNLEHFIKKDIVYDEHIVQFCTMLITTISSQINIYSYTKLNFKKYVKYIVALRDTTNKMLNVRHADDFNSIVADTTNWYHIFEIISNKLRFLEEINTAPDNKNKFKLQYLKPLATELFSTSFKYQIKALMTALEDQSYFGSGVYDIILRMYNHNTRRIIHYLCEAFDNESNAREYCRLCQKIKDLESANMKDNTIDPVKLNNRKLIEAYKHASRSFVLRLLINQIKAAGYFKGIGTVVGGDDSLGSSYARKILTYVGRKQPKHYSTEMDTYESFADIVNYILKRPNNSAYTVNESDIQKISNVICHMSDPEMETTNWCQLIIVKFNQKNFDKDLLAKRMKEQYEKFISNDPQYDNKSITQLYGVRITDAGRAFLSIMPDFEYFACRYAYNYKPLFSNENLERIQGAKKYKCIELINIIYKQTEKCCKSILNRDKSFFEISANAGISWGAMYSCADFEKFYLYKNQHREQTHIQRIIDSHISYLDHYMNYIISLTEDELPQEQKDDIAKLVRLEINSYIKLLKHFVDSDLYYYNKDRDGKYYIGYHITNKNERALAYYSEYERCLIRSQQQPKENIWIQKSKRNK